MRYAMYLPTQGPFADARLLADLAREADAAGWDGFFIWDELLPFWEHWPESADSWIAMTAIAMATQRIRFGALVTPLARRRPAVVARESVTLDHLSNGRLVLGIGLGNPDTQFTAFGEEGDARVRAAKTDEFLELLTKLWSGEAVAFAGDHYRAECGPFLPRPVQEPRIPVWVGAGSRNRAPLRRAARWDGFVPASPGWPDEVVSPDEYHQMRERIQQLRTTDAPVDIGVISNWTGDLPATTPESVREYADAGVTWWLVQAGTPELARERIRAGSPAR